MLFNFASEEPVDITIRNPCVPLLNWLWGLLRHIVGSAERLVSGRTDGWMDGLTDWWAGGAGGLLDWWIDGLMD